jgi:four helix bundle protein
MEVKELRIYQVSEQLSDLIWNIYDQWPDKAKKTIGIQAIRAADSISANIAEGFGRFHYRDKLMFYYYARGSFEETKSWIRKMNRRNLLNADDKAITVSLINNLGPLLNAFIKGAKRIADSRKRSEAQIEGTPQP